MGIVRIGPPESLVISLKKYFGATCFIETGTHAGDTSYWASKHFEQVTTIELSAEYHRRAEMRFRDCGNIKAICGPSPPTLEAIVPTLALPAIFWLDAHWSGGDTAGADNPCPLVEELAILRRSSLNHIILIDDARLFCLPPPAPQDPARWPTIAEVIFALVPQKNYIFIYEDVVVAVPLRGRTFVSEWLRNESLGNLAPRRFEWLQRIFRYCTYDKQP